MNQHDVNAAEELFQAGSADKLYELLLPFLKEEDPLALYYYSKFSLSEWKESREDYDRRSIECLKKAVEGGVPEAMYRMALYYFVGDGVEKNPCKGRQLLDSAAEAGLGVAIYSSGINYFYGSNGYPEDRDRSFQFLEKAIALGVEGAREDLLKLKQISQ